MKTNCKKKKLIMIAILFTKVVWRFNQGCGNTLSDLVPFHSGQVENFYLLVLGQVQMYLFNKILFIIF